MSHEQPEKVTLRSVWNYHWPLFVFVGAAVIFCLVYDAHRPSRHAHHFIQKVIAPGSTSAISFANARLQGLHDGRIAAQNLINKK